MCLTSLRSSRPESGSLWTKRSVSRITPILKLRASLNGRRVPQRDLDAAAADVDDHRPPGADVHAVDRRLMDEPRFFGPGDDAWTDAGLALDARQELAAVARFARRAGGGGENLVDAVRFGEPLELRERLQRRVHRFGRQCLAVETAGPESDHHLLAIDDLEREIRADPDDDHVDRVGPDVDGGNAHDVSPTYSRSSCVNPS